ncbi:Uncharacterised protein [uncultured Clostridium sp.]|uniref:hypothetical protein n=1 Tax=uncultured Clostridium sp. TaxID=59620 RepID=UPI0008215BD2|nr:hypothetical protein [uncultured Clostridium sp.]SCJ51860.1 Uncharacterised protein [uncultured Clostridium sp.]
MAQLLKAIVDTQKNNYKAIGQVNAYDSLELELEIKMNGVNVDFVNPSFELISKKADGNRVRQLKDISYADRKIKIIVDDQITACSKSGIVSNQLIIKDEGRMSTCLFYFLLGSSLDREIIQSIDKVEVLEQLDKYVVTAFANLDEFEKRIITGEATIRKLNEDMTAAESNRENAESNRGSTFDDLVLRMNNAIRTAISTDETLNNNEVDRINNYNILKRALEIIREELISLNNSVALEEQKRVQAEIDRTNANIEAINKLNSTNASIEKAEALRGKEWETIKGENKSLKEALTTINNTANSNEEVRKTNEVARVTAERNRVTEFNKIKEDNKVLETNLVKKVDDKIVEIEAQNTQFKDKVTADYNAFTQEVDNQILNSKTDYFGKEHTSVDERLNEDFDNIHQRVNNSEYLPYEGSNITAENSYYGLTKDMVIKGRTLQNLLETSSYVFEQAGGTLDTDFRAVSGVNSLVVTRLTDTVLRYAYFRTRSVNIDRLKPNTKYTVVFGECKNLGTVSLQTGDSLTRITNTSSIQNNKAVLTTIEDLSVADGKLITVFVVPKSYATNDEFVMKDIMILEGDHTNTPMEELPYGEGIYSVGEKEVTPEGKYPVKTKSCGKNLFDLEFDGGITNDNGLYTIPQGTPLGWKNCFKPLKVKPNTGYTLSTVGFRGYGARIGLGRKRIAYYQASSPDTIVNNVGERQSFNSGNTNEIYVGICTDGEYAINKPLVEFNIQLEESKTHTTYEPYQESKSEVLLDEPLRGLPNGVVDEILEDGILIRRIARKFINASWFTSTGTNVPEVKRWFYQPKEEKPKNEGHCLCDKITYARSSATWMEPFPKSCIAINSVGNQIIIYDEEVKGGTAEDKARLVEKYGVMEVLYELETPIVTKIANSIKLKTFDTTTHITSNNYLLPKLSAKVPSNVQAVVSGLRTENEALKTDLKIMNLVTEENNIKNIETNLDQEARLTMIEMGVI